MNGKWVLIWSMIFLYAMFIIGKAELTVIAHIANLFRADKTFVIEDIIFFVSLAYMAAITFKHWLNDVLDWAKPSTEQ